MWRRWWSIIFVMLQIHGKLTTNRFRNQRIFLNNVVREIWGNPKFLLSTHIQARGRIIDHLYCPHPLIHAAVFIPWLHDNDCCPHVYEELQQAAQSPCMQSPVCTVGYGIKGQPTAAAYGRLIFNPYRRS